MCPVFSGILDGQLDAVSFEVKLMVCLEARLVPALVQLTLQVTRRRLYSFPFAVRVVNQNCFLGWRAR